MQGLTGHIQTDLQYTAKLLSLRDHLFTASAYAGSCTTQSLPPGWYQCHIQHYRTCLSSSHTDSDLSLHFCLQVTLAGFRKAQFQVLVATDVAARGLDISGIELVLQTSPPKDHETYIHR